MKIIIASNNKNKVNEINALIFNEKYSFSNLLEYGITEDIPETGSTFRANAEEKAKYVYQKTNIACISDDSGLEIEKLNGAPGVFSARYAGPQKNDSDNIKEVLKNLKGEHNRNARFITVICSIINGKSHFFEGTINGSISQKPMGTNGFGYDPIFIPDGSTKTFAEMTPEEKNRISHRGIAVHKLVDFLNAM